MTTTTANALLSLAAFYAAAGLIVAVPFVLKRVERIDPDARGGSWGFRLAILPGVVALWPWMVLRKAVGDDPEPRERTPHRNAARSRDAQGTA